MYSGARRASRPLCIVAVGGGSVGDAVGFLASVLWRGVDLWHVPTTLLAMVDSAHGGKTAVNLGEAKNQLGTFYPAARVCLCGDVLEALPLVQREEGLAELIKGLWLGDPEGLDLLDGEGGVSALASQPFDAVQESLRDLLMRAIDVKLKIVAQDPFEQRGVRTVLNLGHTAAHALELSAGLSHGHAVAWGMAAAARLSRELGYLERAEELRLLRHLDPLLSPVRDLEHRLDQETFIALVGRDKKREAGQLRSVLLEGPGQPLVTTEVTPARWYQALMEIHAAWLAAPRRVSVRRVGLRALELAASKSELNRALIIAALHPQTEARGESDADDVAFMRQCLDELARHPDDEATIQCGLGGTTFRFLLALAAARRAPTVLLADERLLERPHQPLYDALAQLGATITPVTCDDQRGPRGLRGLRGLRITPAASIAGREVAVRCEESSQHASAVAMLAAMGEPLTLILRTDEVGFTPGELASQSYLEMTFELLEAVGVEVRWHGERVRLTPGPEFDQPHVLTASADESSAAVWRAARALGLPIELPNVATGFSLQADRVMQRFLDRMVAASAEETVELDLRDCPDLAPVLCATAALLPCGLKIGGAAHLRHKESNRIDELAEAFAGVGVTITAQEDGLLIPPGAQAPIAESVWRTFGDHRLAMAGALLVIAGQTLIIERPWVVTKSYPEFWHHARRVGYEVEFIEG